MQLQIGNYVLRPAGGFAKPGRVQPKGRHRLGQADAVRVQALQKRLLEPPGQGTAAQVGGVEPHALLISEPDDLDGIGQAAALAVQFVDTGDARYDAQHAVEFSGHDDRVEM
jgi:hypothetical protein